MARHLNSYLCLVLITGGLVVALEAQEKETVPAPAAPRVTSLPTLPVAVRDALQARKYEEAVKLIAGLLEKEATPARDYLLYQMGRALVELERYDDADVAFKRLEETYPQSAWLSRARFGRGLSMSKRRNFQAAGVIYRAETERLLSGGRRDALAAIYLEFADRYFAGTGKMLPEVEDEPKPEAPVPNGATPIENALRETISINADEIPFQKLVASIADLSEIDIVLEMESLKDLGISPNAPISLHVKDVQVVSLLAILLNPLQLTTRIVDNELHVIKDSEAPTQGRDFNRALSYYRQALGIRPSLPLRRYIELRIARSLFELTQASDAANAYRAFLASYASPTTQPDEHCTLAEEAEARFELGRAWLAGGQSAEARKTWEDFLASDSAQATSTLVAEARYQLSRTYGMPSPSTIGELELGAGVLERFLKDFPKHQKAPQAEYEIAQGYANHGRYLDVVARLNQLIANPIYAGSPQIPQAWKLLGEAYRAQQKFDDAIAAWKQFLEKFPTDAHWSSVQQQIIDVEYQMADAEREAKHYAVARQLWETFLNKYPLDYRAPQILLQFGSMQFAQAAALEQDARENAKKERKEPPKTAPANAIPLFEAAIGDWRRLISKYPEAESASQAAYLIGVTLEDRLGRLSEALAAYKKVEGDYVERAHRRMGFLIDKQLSIVTPRKFRSNEAPYIEVSTRNLESVTVKVYRIDMADYFRKMHLASGVEDLDIALIDPDKTWDEKIPNYEQYRRVENNIKIPLEGEETAGVTAVTVSSDKLEATTMVLVSDLDMIVKASRNELFVFVENMRTGQPVEGTSLLISDGEKIFAEDITGKDGILQKAYKELETVSDLRVFAAFEGHSASSVSRLEGLEFSVGLIPKGDIYTDRPIYRAGQLVNVKGLIRWVNGDEFTFKAGEKYQLDIYDSRGRVLQTQEVALGEFGTFSHRFMLPATAPQGDYRVHVFQPNGTQSYEGSFQVREYQLQPLQLVINLPRTVYYRGEDIEGTITLQYYYGTPVANRQITYRLGESDRLYEAVTDAQGAVKFSIPTQQYSETQSLELLVSYAERNLEARQMVYLATRGINIDVDTMRNVYVAGETFDATVSVKDPAGQPLATELKFEVFERTLTDGKFGERLVSSFELKTDEKTGEARQTVRIEKSGRYLLRATGIDRFQNQVSGEHVLAVSGDDDTIRLRILADQHHFKVGDTAGVTLHWRDEPALALVTFEGARILKYQLVELKTGANRLELPMESALAPNFELAVAVMQGNKFHQARSPFQVDRKLQIKLTPSLTLLKPGDPLTVNIIVTDAQGNPVSAELSLGLIQQNLLQLGRPRDAVHELFGNGMRVIAMRSETSCTFSYHPETEGISPFLLAERERQRIQVMESAARENGRLQLFGETVNGVAEGSVIISSDGDGLNDLLVLDPQQSELDRWDFNGELSLGFLGGASNSNRRQDQTKAVFERLEELDETAIPNYANGARIKYPDFQRDLSEHRLWSNPMVDGPGPGVLAEYETKLSLIIRQTQIVQGDENGNILWKNVANADRTLLGINTRGEVQVLNGLPAERLAKLAKEGLEVVPTGGQSETGYWNPAVVTDREGKSQITFNMPENSTAWQLQARGIDKQTLAGDASVDITTRKDLFGEAKLPLAFHAGDKAHVLVEVHQSKLKKEDKIDVTLKTSSGEKTTILTKTLTVGDEATLEAGFDIDLATGAESATFELTVSSGELVDISTQTVPVLPDGLPVFAAKSGTSGQSTTVFVEHEKGIKAEQPTLEIVIGPSVNRTLLDAVLDAGTTRYESSFALPHSDIERNVSDILGGISLLKLIGQSRNSETPEAQALTARIQGSLSQLISAQRTDGGWSWSGLFTSDRTDAYVTARVIWALSAARKAGFAVPADVLNKALTILRTSFTSFGESEDEGKAILLHSLAEAGAADFAAANRLYRNRQSLSASGLLYTALTLVRLDRQSMAIDLLTLAQAKIPVDPAVAAEGAEAQMLAGVIPWMQCGVELRALLLMVLNETQPVGNTAHVAQAGKVATWLMEHRYGSRWQPEKANGPALVALGTYFASTKVANEKYTLSVFVNNRLLEKLTVDPSHEPSRHLQVPARMLVAGQQRINFDIEGRGTFSYSAVLGGFVPSDKLKSTTNDWRLSRTYEPAQRMFEGKPVPRGFGVVTGNYTSFQNNLTQLPLGERGEVTLSVYRYGNDKSHHDYLVVTEPIPAGASVLTESISGTYERFELSPGAITFYLGNQLRSTSIHYTLVGYLPGEYKIVPTLARSFYRPDKMAVDEPRKLTVLERGGKSQDEYRLTPDELFGFGTRYAEKQDYASAIEPLSTLFQNWQLRSESYRKVVLALFDCALALKKAGETVRFFEIIREKFPDAEVSFDSILNVGAAYQELGEYERCYLVYRATAEASFERESQIAGFLDKQGEFVRSVQVMERLLREYPAEAYIAVSTYALAQEVYGKAPTAANDHKLLDSKITRVDLIATAITMLDHFLATWPEDPATDQASFSLVNALLDLEKYDAAIARATEFSERFPDSQLLDSFWYAIGFGQFALGKPEPALEMCQKVAQATRKDPQSGIEVAAANKWQAVYIMGQIYHSLGKPAEAIQAYARVEDRFPDAAQAIEFFTRPAIELPEVTTIKPGEAGEVLLKFRNVPDVDIKVYRIDLMKFGLMQRNLSKITAINLAGIRPYHELKIALGDGKDYRDRERKLELPLKEEGAYLVVGRGGSLYASGLVLVSPLTLEIQEDPQSGRVRVTVRNSVEERYAHDVHVKVIGSDNEKFVSGETDLRGIFVADGINGTSTIIARMEQNKYAFFRGKTYLGAPPQPSNKSGTLPEAPNAAPSSTEKLLENLRGTNRILQQEQQKNYRDLLDNGTQGVNPSEAF